MEGNLSPGGTIPGDSYYGGLDLQGSVRGDHQAQHPHTFHYQHGLLPRQGSLAHPSVNEGFPPTMGAIQNCDQTVSVVEYSRGDGCKNSASDEDERSFAEEGAEDHHDAATIGKMGSPWQRVKWTDKMVRLLITAVSYMGEDTAIDSLAGRRKFAILQKKGKWKSVSKVMAERGFHVSPQQCEDKFNDLNKRYKKLNDVLGRGTSCQVVENPTLLDMIDYVTEKEKDDVKKILSSKHLFYEEMCSYHNGNRLHLPHDTALQRSLQLALRSRDDHDDDERRRNPHDDFDEDDHDHDAETDDHDEYDQHQASHGDNRGAYGLPGSYAKKMRQDQGHEYCFSGSSINSLDCNKISNSHAQNQMLPDGTKAAFSQKQWSESRSLQLEEKKLQIQADMLELEKEQFKWERFSRKRDHELEELRVENESMKIENERLTLELKRKEMGTA